VLGNSKYAPPCTTPLRSRRQVPVETMAAGGRAGPRRAAYISDSEVVEAIRGGLRKRRRGARSEASGRSGVPPVRWWGGPHCWWVGRPESLQRRRRGRKSKTTKSLLDHQNRRSDVWKRGDLCNSPNKINPAKKGWGGEHLQTAKGAHHGCQVYEGKETKRSLKTTK
jgi:hypothetical protein